MDTKVRLFGTAAVVAACSLLLAGCADPNNVYPGFSGISTEMGTAITEMQTVQLQGYTTGQVDEPVVGPVGMDPNRGISFTKTVSATDTALECKAFIAWAKQLGAFERRSEPGGIQYPLADHEAQAQISCVATLAGLTVSPGDLLGYAGNSFDLSGVHKGNRTPEGVTFTARFSLNLLNRKTSTDPLQYQYLVYLRTTYTQKFVGGNGIGAADTAPPKWDAANQQADPAVQSFQNVLDRIGSYRLTHPRENPYSLSSLKAALVGYDKAFPANPVSFSFSPDGSIHRIHISVGQTKSSVLPVCVSIAKYDPAFFGNPDPGIGYSLGYQDLLTKDSQFGQDQTGSCPVWK